MIYIKSNEHNIINNYNDKVKMILRSRRCYSFMLHGVVYAMKVRLRGESVRDHVDLLLSMKHLPDLVVNDMPEDDCKA